MAERGAFLTAPVVSRPSVFEVLAQESLAATVHPALARLANFLATYDPERCGWIINWFEEIYLILNFSVQKHYMRSYGGSFAETFYGMCRFGLSRRDGSLSARERRVSLLLVVLVDYAGHKLARLVERWRESPDPQGLVSVVRWLQAAWRGVCLTTLLGYMTGRLDYHSPLLRLAGVALQTAAEEPQPRDLSKLSVVWRGAAMVGPALARCFEFGAFSLQFLQWWHAEGPRPQLTALPTPPPPQLMAGAGEYSEICPICVQSRRIETALPISGFVFCYRCIATHLAREGSCPVTKYPAKQSDLVRLYPDS